MWLTQLNHAISTCERKPSPVPPKPEPKPSLTECNPLQLTMHHSVAAFERIFPKWEWNSDPDEFSMCFQLDPVPELNSYASLSQDNWSTCIYFLCSVAWKKHDNIYTAFVELAFLAKLTGFVFFTKTPSQSAILIRKVINQLTKIQIEGIPGRTCPKSKCVGKPLPAGCLLGYLPLFSNHSLKDWNIEFWFVDFFFSDGTPFHTYLLRYPIGISASLRGIYHGKWYIFHRIQGEISE